MQLNLLNNKFLSEIFRNTNTKEKICGHKSLSIFVHYVPNLLSVRDPASAVSCSTKNKKHASGRHRGHKQHWLLVTKTPTMHMHYGCFRASVTLPGIEPGFKA